MNTIKLITTQERNRIMTDFFTDYCTVVSGGDPLLMQLMLIDKPLQHWFKRQFKQGEQRFFNYMVRLNTPIKVAKAKELYIRMATDHIDKYSKRILYELKRKAKAIRQSRDRKTTIYSQLHLN